MDFRAFDESKPILENLEFYGFRPSAGGWMESNLDPQITESLFFKGNYLKSMFVDMVSIYTDDFLLTPPC